MSELWEFPLVVRKDGASRHGNQQITWLMTDPYSGVVSFPWLRDIGNCIVGRLERRDFSPELCVLPVAKFTEAYSTTLITESRFLAIIEHAYSVLDMASPSDRLRCCDPLCFRNNVLKLLPKLSLRDLDSWAQREFNPFARACILNSEANALTRKNRNWQAKHKYQRALRLLENDCDIIPTDMSYLLCHNVLTNIAHISHEIGDFKEARGYADRAVGMHAAGPITSSQAAVAHWMRSVTSFQGSIDFNDLYRSADDWRKVFKGFNTGLLRSGYSPAMRMNWLWNETRSCDF